MTKLNGSFVTPATAWRVRCRRAKRRVNESGKTKPCVCDASGEWPWPSGLSARTSSREPSLKSCLRLGAPVRSRFFARAFMLCICICLAFAEVPPAFFVLLCPTKQHTPFTFLIVCRPAFLETANRLIDQFRFGFQAYTLQIVIHYSFITRVPPTTVDERVRFDGYQHTQTHSLHTELDSLHTELNPDDGALPT
jgi:hypothetical protein